MLAGLFWSCASHFLKLTSKTKEGKNVNIPYCIGLKRVLFLTRFERVQIIWREPFSTRRISIELRPRMPLIGMLQSVLVLEFDNP